MKLWLAIVLCLVGCSKKHDDSPATYDLAALEKQRDAMVATFDETTIPRCDRLTFVGMMQAFGKDDGAAPAFNTIAAADVPTVTDGSATTQVTTGTQTFAGAKTFSSPITGVVIGKRIWASSAMSFQSTITSASFVNFSTPVALTFTPDHSGYYRLNCVPNGYANSNSVSFTTTIALTAGAGSGLLFLQNANISTAVGNQPLPMPTSGSGRLMLVQPIPSICRAPYPAVRLQYAGIQTRLLFGQNSWNAQVRKGSLGGFVMNYAIG